MSESTGLSHLIIEVKLSPKEFHRLRPDEDWLEVAEDGGFYTLEHDPILARKIDRYRKDLHSHKADWPKSLERIGNVAHFPGIRREFLKRYCTIDFSQRPFLTENWFRELSEGKRRFFSTLALGEQVTSWLFADVTFLPRIKPSMPDDVLHRESSDRSGIQVEIIE